MANLIPPDAKRAVVIEYWIRVATVWFVIIGCGFIVITFLKLPTFVLVQSQLKAFSGAYNEARAKEDTFTQAEQTIKKANNLSALLSTYATTTPLSELVTVLDTIAGNDVVIETFNFEATEAGVKTISITGIAFTRAALAHFSDAIEQHVLFEKADLPISNLAKDKDISFTISVIPATQK